MEFRPDSVPDGRPARAAAVGRTLAAPLRRGEPVTDVRLVGPSLLRGYPGLVAVPVRIPDPGTVALLRVGDRVDLLVTETDGSAARLLAGGVPVLALPVDPEGAHGPVGGERAAGGARHLAGAVRAGVRRGRPGLSGGRHLPLAWAHPTYGSPGDPAGREELHMVQGFKEFILKGNLVELAVAFIMGLAFASVVTDVHRRADGLHRQGRAASPTSPASSSPASTSGCSSTR